MHFKAIVHYLKNTKLALDKCTMFLYIHALFNCLVALSIDFIYFFLR